MRVEEVLRRSTEQLAATGAETPRLDAERLLGHALGVARAELYEGRERALSTAELDSVRELVARRARREPLQYVLGEWGFRRLALAVDRRALIPRPETEALVERCLALLAGEPAPRVLDVGTGGGAIALAIADEHPGARVTALDVSPDALALAAENSASTGIEIELVRGDLFAGLPRGPWDLVVSNPPYVEAEAFAELAPELSWEPKIALVSAGAVEAVAVGALEVLASGGALALEVGDGQAAGTAQLLGRLRYRAVRVSRDLAGCERVVEARRA